MTPERGGQNMEAKERPFQPLPRVTVRTILYHGRFQPPHRGHLSLIRLFLMKYKDARLVVSIDSRPPDERNPFSLAERRSIFAAGLARYADRLVFTSHVCNEPTVEGCLPNAHQAARRYGEVDLVAAGPDMDRKAVEFWENRGIPVEIVPRRLFGLSGTAVRAVLRARASLGSKKP